MRKILLYLFIMFSSCVFSQQSSDLIEYQFNSTSSYITTQRGGTYVNNYPAVTPETYTSTPSGPRRANSGDNPRPGYDPADPSVPVGDVDGYIIVGIIIAYFIIEKLRQRKNRSKA